jgi:hypothetical protein
MPKTGKTYPDWVQKYRTRGTTVKKKGERYYLYKRTSRRVPGKKYPQPVDTYIGVITPEGVIQSDKKKVTLTDASVKEFGFSRAVEILCPQSWKEPLGKEWRKVLDFVILKESAESYISAERGSVETLDPHIQYGAQKSSLIRRMQKETGADLKDLKRLSTIYLIYMDGNKLISRISDEQREILERFHINLEVD